MWELYNVIVLGDSGVGKTNLLTCHTGFSRPVRAMGMDYVVKIIFQPHLDVTLKIIDPSGNKRDILPQYVSNKKGALLVYDIQNRESFKSVQKLAKEFMDAVTFPSPVLAIVGTKADMDHKRVVTTEEAEQFARENNFLFFETSATTNFNVEKCFLDLAVALRKRNMCLHRERFSKRQKNLTCNEPNI